MRTHLFTPEQNDRIAAVRAMGPFTAVKMVDPSYAKTALILHLQNVVRFHESELAWKGTTHLGYLLVFGNSVRTLRELERDDDGYCTYALQRGDFVVRTGYVRGRKAMAHVYIALREANRTDEGHERIGGGARVYTYEDHISREVDITALLLGTADDPRTAGDAEVLPRYGRPMGRKEFQQWLREPNIIDLKPSNRLTED